MTLLYISTPTALLQSNTPLFVFPLMHATIFASLAQNAVKFSILFVHVQRQRQAWWSAKVDEAVIEKRKTFAAADRSDENCQAYISASRHALSVIAKAKAEA